MSTSVAADCSDSNGYTAVSDVAYISVPNVRSPAARTALKDHMTSRGLSLPDSRMHATSC